MTRRPGRELVRCWATGAVVATMVALGHAAPALAQRSDGVGSVRPYRGLFGGNQTSPSSGPNNLVFTGSLFGGYDDDIFARGQGPRSRNARVSGEMAGTQVGLNYAHRTPRSVFSIASGAAGRYVVDNREFVPTYYGGSIGYSRSLSTRTSMELRHGAAYQPFFSIVPQAGTSTLGPSIGDPGEDLPFDEVGTAPPDDFTVAADRKALRQSGSARLSHRLTPRSSVSMMGGYSFADFQRSEFDDLSNTRWRAQANYTYDLSRYLGVRLGYGYRTFGRRDGRTQGNHNINVGLLYNQPFVLQRGQTRFSFSTGSSLLMRDRLDSENDKRRRLVLRATGNASLLHVFNPNWQVQANYTRSVGWVDGLGQAMQGDLVSAGLGGILNRRTDVMATVGYTSGAIGLRERNFDTLLGSARIRVALTPNMALFGQYFYYQYSFDDSLVEQLIVAPELERQGVRVGLTVWLPLIR